MKRFLFLLALIPSIALADGPAFIYKSTPGPRCSNGLSCSGLTDQWGRVFTINGGAAPVTSLAPVTPVPQTTQLATAVPTAFGTPQFVNSTCLTSVHIDASTLDQKLRCEYGASVTPIAPFEVPAGSVFYDNFSTRGESMCTHVRCIHPSTLPSTGWLNIYGTTH